MDFLKKRKIAAERRRFMLRNGKFMLEELISSFNGKSNPIRNFSAPVILKSTNNFDSTLIYNWEYQYVSYKGIIEDLPILAKRSCHGTFVEDEMKKITKDIAVSSQMSSHKNVLKLLGCCLEFLYPVLVFEYVEKGPLNVLHGGLNSRETLPWNIRLKIAKETANAVAYLHTAFPKRIVHRNLTPSKILLDEKWTAKISDFSESILIPDGEPHVKHAEDYGTPGFIDYYSMFKGSINESADVFGFGTFLLILITAKPPIKKPAGFIEPHVEHAEDYWMEEIMGRLRELVVAAKERNQLIDILDQRLVEEAVVKEGFELQQMQWQAFIELGLKCSRYNGEDRPDMIEVAKILARIEKFTELSDVSLDGQTDHVVPPVESS